jgi:hypothetical protein
MPVCMPPPMPWSIIVHSNPCTRLQKFHMIEDSSTYEIVRGDPAYRSEVSKIMREATALARLNHPNVLRLQGVVRDAHHDVTMLVRRRDDDHHAPLPPPREWLWGPAPLAHTLLPTSCRPLDIGGLLWHASMCAPYLLLQILDFADKSLEQYCSGPVDVGAW